MEKNHSTSKKVLLVLLCLTFAGLTFATNQYLLKSKLTFTNLMKETKVLLEKDQSVASSAKKVFELQNEIQNIQNEQTSLFIKIVTFVFSWPVILTFISFIILLSLKEKYQVKNEDLAHLKQFNDILSSTPSCLKIVDREGNLLEMNAQGLEIIGIKSIEAAKKNKVYDLIEESYRDKYIKFNQRICNGEKGNLIFDILTVDGRRRTLETYAAPFTLANGEIAHISITNDITEKIKEKNELEHQRKLAQHSAKLASIGELAAGVGHEINNPLSVIKGYLFTIKNLYKNAPDTPLSKVYNAIEKIEVASDRIAKIVGGLRTFSRSDSMEICDFNVLTSTVETIDLIKDLFGNDGVNLKLDVSHCDRNTYVNGNQGKFQQILINLISNAKDAVKNSSKRDINIILTSHADQLILTVSDSGHGIPSEIKDKIFEPFYTTKEVNKGTGIGLALVNTFIEEFNGKISVASEANIGTTFTLNFPSVILQLILSPTPVEKNEIALSGLQGNVLLVDDEEEVRNILADVLVQMGLNVTVAEDGQVAYQLYSKEPNYYDLIISDMKMPILDGPHLLKKIRDSKNSGHQPKFIFFTGGINVDFENPKSDIGQLHDGYFYKPFQIQHVHQVISNVLSTGQKIKTAS